MIFNHLGMIFLYSPDKNNIYEDYIQPFQSERLEWPVTIDIDSQLLLMKYFENIDWRKERIIESWRMISGELIPSKASPYSSVYLDPENVIYGSSYHNFIKFLSEKNIRFSLDRVIPEDHIGVMLLAFSFLIIDDEQGAKTLFNNHLMTWCESYLSLLESEYLDEYFYRFISRLTRATLESLKE